MIWGIILCSWGLVTALTWQSNRRGMTLAGISFIASLGMYYWLGYPNLPDHPYKAMVELLKIKSS